MAREHGVVTTPESIQRVRAMTGHSVHSIIPTRARPNADKIHNQALRPDGKQVVDATPGAFGPCRFSPVNREAHLDRPDVNMVICGGKAAILILAASSPVASAGAQSCRTTFDPVMDKLHVGDITLRVDLLRAHRPA